MISEGNESMRHTTTNPNNLRPAGLVASGISASSIDIAYKTSDDYLFDR